MFYFPDEKNEDSIDEKKLTLQKRNQVRKWLNLTFLGLCSDCRLINEISVREVSRNNKTFREISLTILSVSLKLTFYTEIYVEEQEFTYLQVIILFYTVKKAESDAGPKQKSDGKFHHPRQHQRLGLSIYKGDGIFRQPCVVVTLGFSNSVQIINPLFLIYYSHAHASIGSLLKKS
jgi:hypothetical protein